MTAMKYLGDMKCSINAYYSCCNYDTVVITQFVGVFSQ